MSDCNFNYGQSTDLRTNEEKLIAFRNHVLEQSVPNYLRVDLAASPDVWHPEEEFFDKMKQKKC